MSESKTFSAKRIAQLRQPASKTSEVPEDWSASTVDPVWSKSPVDPMAVLAVFKPLKIKEGFVLRAYRFRAGGNGNGFVWAMPVDADFPEPEECPRLQHSFLEPPKPPAAFYTFSQLGQEAIYRHADTYRPGSYRFETERTEIGTGPGGVVF